MRRALEHERSLATRLETDSFPRRAPRCDGFETDSTKVGSPKVRGKKEGWPWRKAWLARCRFWHRTMPFLVSL